MGLILEGSQPHLPSAASGLPTASGAGEVPVSSGAGTSYTATARSQVVGGGFIGITSGSPAGTTLLADGAGDLTLSSADLAAFNAAANAAAARTAIGAVPTSRTVAGAALSGDISTATLRTALGITYRAPQTPAIGPFSATAYLGGDVGHVEPSVVQGKSLAVTFWKREGVGGVEQEIVSRLDAVPARGWALGILTSGDFYFYEHGPGAVTLGGYDSLATGLHTLALTVHSTGATSYEIRYSIDGGVVAVATYAGATPVVPADATTPLLVGRQAYTVNPYPFTAGDLYEVTTTSTEASDADLRLLSAAATPHPAVASGTVAFNVLGPRDVWPGHATATTGAGSQTWDLTIHGGLTRWNH
jgi:hypothetical protein